MTREEAIDILDEILRLNLGLEQKGHRRRNDLKNLVISHCQSHLSFVTGFFPTLGCIALSGCSLS